MQLVARSGDAVPGRPGLTFDHFGQASINHGGQLALAAVALTATGVSRDTILVGNRDAGLSLVAAAGDHAPGTPDGVVFDFFPGSTVTVNTGPVAFNASGDYAFFAGLNGPGVTNANNVGIWAGEGASLRLVAREGDVLSVNGVAHTIAGLNLNAGSGGEDGLPTGLDDLGQLAFVAHFTDGTDAVFLASVPEPGTAMMMALSGLGLLRRRRHVTAR
jgi:hypothetical protein